MKCKMGIFDLTTLKGKCPETCPYGAWNDFHEGVCGAECLECGGDLYLDENGKVYCTDCGETEMENIR